MKNVLLVICFFFVTFNLIFAVENVDVIKLKDGTILKGEILETNDNFVIIKTSLGEIKIEKENIKITPVTIYLKDDNIIKGNLIKRNEKSINVETSLGSFEIKLDNIKKMIEETNNNESSNTDLTSKTNNDTEMGIKAIGNAFLYQQRQKKISTALGFQALGAGLLYSEKYTMGTIMLLAENGLLVSSAFVNDPDVVPYLWISGIALKAFNTFFTIKSVNDYNNKLAKELGIIDGISSKEIRLGTRKGYFYFAPNTGINFDEKLNFNYGGNIGYFNTNFGKITANLSKAGTQSTKTEIFAVSLQYEKPLNISNFSYFTPKLGFGYTQYRNRANFYDSSGDLLGYNHVRIRPASLICGIAFEYDVSKSVLVKLGYDLSLSLGDSKATYGIAQLSFGFKI